MAIEVERLVATLEARLDKYEKGLAKARGITDQQFGRIERRGAQMEARLGSVGKTAFLGFVRGALATLAPVLSVAAAINGAKAAMKTFGDIADNAKASGLDPEFFQGLTHQFDLAGISIDTSAGALATFAKNSGLAVAGKGRMVTALKALNPALLENIRAARNQEERIRLVADALAQEEDASKRAAIATAAFGEAGGKIAGAFAGGAAAIDATMQKAREMGLIVDRELIARADALGDEFDTAARIVDLQLKQAFINAAPALVALVGFAGDLTRALNLAVDGMNRLENQQTSTLQAELSALRAAQKVGNPLGLPTDIFGIDAAKIAELTEVLRRRGLRNNAPRRSSAAASDDDDILDLDATAESVKRLHSEYDAWADDGVGKLIEKHQEWAQTMAGDVVGGIRSIWEAYKSGGNVLDAILEKVMNLGEQMLFSGLQNLLSGALGGATSGGWNVPTSFVPGGFFPAFPGKASGGPVQGGRPYVVGERGPEMFVPSSAGRIVPGVPSGGGGKSVIINVDARGAQRGVGEEIAVAMRQMMPEIDRRIDQRSPFAVAKAQSDRRLG